MIGLPPPLLIIFSGTATFPANNQIKGASVCSGHPRLDSTARVCHQRQRRLPKTADS